MSMPQEDEHPPLTKRAQGAIAVLALSTGLGISLMSFHLLLPGLVLALAGAAGSVWIYAGDLKRLRLLYVRNGITEKPSAEMVVVITMLAAAILVPFAIFMHETIADIRADGRPSIRHLSDNQKERLRASLKLRPDEHYDFQINTAPSCDECEQFAEELRTFFSSIPGLQASGGPLIFPGNYGRGIQYVSNGKPGGSPGGSKILAALQDAGVIVVPSPEPQMKDGDFVVLIGRP